VELVEKDLNFEKELEGSFKQDEIVHTKMLEDFIFSFLHNFFLI
jgi:hypothetical protein